MPLLQSEQPQGTLFLILWHTCWRWVLPGHRHSVVAVHELHQPFALVLPIKWLYWQGFDVLRSLNEVEKIWNDFFFLPGTRFWSDDLISGWKGSGSICAQVVLSAKALLYVGLCSNSYCLALEQLFWRFPYAFCTAIITSKTLRTLQRVTSSVSITLPAGRGRIKAFVVLVFPWQKGLMHLFQM